MDSNNKLNHKKLFKDDIILELDNKLVGYGGKSISELIILGRTNFFITLIHSPLSS